MTEVAAIPKDLITPKESVEDVQEDKITSKEKTPVKEVKANNGNSDEITKLEGNIIRQMEYYFGDENLQRDKFLLEQINKDEEGWVPLTVLLTFKRLSNLSQDPEVIVNAVHKSDEGLLIVSEDKTKIRRHPERPIPEHNEERRKEISSRTAYAKGFPLDSEMSDIIDFFHPFEKVVNITMRKYLDKPTKVYKFKGSCFVTFAKKEQCEEFLNKDKVEYKERELTRKWQEKYFEEKRDERSEKSKKSKKGKKEEQETKIQLPQGSVLHFEGVTDSSLQREVIKESMEDLGAEVAYIEYNKGDKSGYIRLTTENSAKPILEKIENQKLKLKNTEVELTLRVLEEDEEKTFLKKAIESMKSRRTNSSRSHKGGHGHGHHHRDRHGHGGGNRKRRGNRKDDDDGDIDGGDDEPAAKQTKDD